MWFGYNPQTHFSQFELSRFWDVNTKNVHVVCIYIFSDYISVTIQLRRGT